MTGMSPVMTSASGLTFNEPHRTVVSREFGKQFSKIHFISGSRIRAYVTTITDSIIGLWKHRWDFGGRWETNAEMAGVLMLAFVGLLEVPDIQHRRKGFQGDWLFRLEIQIERTPGQDGEAVVVKLAGDAIDICPYPERGAIGG